MVKPQRWASTQPSSKDDVKRTLMVERYPVQLIQTNMKINDDAIVLKINKTDKQFIRQMAMQERMSMSAYIRNVMCAGETELDVQE